MNIGHRDIKDDLYRNFARIGKALSSPKRLEIIDLLCQGERSVEEIAGGAELTVGNASAQLKVLFGARLLERRQAGKRVFYRMAGPGVVQLFRGLQHVGEEQIAEVHQLVQAYYQSPSEFEPVSPAELQRLIDEEGVLVLDVRPASEYRAGHIPTAVNVPPGELAQRLRGLRADRDIVAYCRGRYCLFSVEAVTLLNEYGYRARRLAIGLPDWSLLGLPVSTLPDHSPLALGTDH